MAKRTASPQSSETVRGPLWRLERVTTAVAFIALSLLALWLSSDMEIMAIDSPLDDQLFLQKAESTVWFGNEGYSKYILFKEPTYSLFVAAAYRLAIPLRLAHECFYLAAAGCLAFSLTYRQTQPWVGLAVFAAVALYPIHFTAFQRAGHSSFYISLMVATPAAFLWQFKRRGERWRWLRWLCSGLVLGLLLNTRQERPLALLLVGPFVLSGLVVEWQRSGRRWRAIRRWCVEWLPPLAIEVIATLGIAWGNYVRWGVFAGSDLQAPNFKAAYRALLQIKPDHPIPYVPVTRDMLEKAYAVSPTLKRLAAFLERDAEPQSRTWNYFQDMPPGEYSGGWFVTSLRDAVESAGQYNSGPETEAFYGAIVRELHDAERAGRLQTRWLPPGSNWVIHPYPETYISNLVTSWRSLWYHSWSAVWQFGPSPASGYASKEVEYLFDRVACRRSVETSQRRNDVRNAFWNGFNTVMEPMLAAGFLIAAAVLFLHRNRRGWSAYLLPAIAFGSYGVVGFAVFTIIDASTIPTRDYLFPSILAMTITAVWLSVEGLRLLANVQVSQETKRRAADFTHPRWATVTGSVCVLLSFLLFAQWAYGKFRPPDSTEEAGRLEKVDETWISGWARLRNRPAESAQVEVFVDGTLTSTAPADQHRQDLVDSHIGSGRHAFRIETPNILKDGKPHIVDVRIAGTNYRLADTPRTVTLTPADGADAEERP